MPLELLSLVMSAPHGNPILSQPNQPNQPSRLPEKQSLNPQQNSHIPLYPIY